MDKPNDFEKNKGEGLVERRDFLGGAATLAGTSLIGLGLPSSVAAAEAATDRMPPIPTDKMTDAQKKSVQELLSGPRKAVDGPFVPLLRSPEFMNRLQKMGEYLRYNTNLGSAVSEFIILITARQWTQQYEWDSHVGLAMKAGVTPEITGAIAEGRRPVGMSSDQETVYNFCTELLQNKCVSDPTYERALKRFDEQGVIDITGICGYYSLLGMIMNVARTPMPAGKTPPLALYPH
jgi:4-carboxymuconolactone decarboxylase